MQSPKLRDKRSNLNNKEPYALGLIPNEVIITIAKYIVYFVALEQKDISDASNGVIFFCSSGKW